jgi:hypothetical protein
VDRRRQKGTKIRGKSKFLIDTIWREGYKSGPLEYLNGIKPHKSFVRLQNLCSAAILNTPSTPRDA